MSPPTERFKKLSLESMPPVTRLQSQRLQAEDSSSESETEPDFDFDDDGYMTSPSNLRYSLDLLDEETRDNVTRAIEVPSQFMLRGCQAGDQRCLFLVTEPVEYTIRTGTEQSGYGIPSCTCESGERGESPCRHILWLFDQITSQVLGVQRDPFILSQHGFPTELGNPYDAISDFHLDMLADSLHCDVINQSAYPNPRRVQETREILASLNEVPIDEYRPDLFDNPRRGKKVIKRGDLEQTIFRMLLCNDDFFQYFLSSMRADELNKNRFRSLQHRADAALAGLREYAETPSLQTVARPKNVEWCAMHLAMVTHQIHSVIHNTDRPLETWELRAAARTAVHALEQVADHNQDIGPADLPKEKRNLFFRLIGDQDRNFAVDVLSSIPPQILGPWIDDLTAVQEKISDHGAPDSYTTRLGSLMSHLRSRWAAAGSKRTGQGQDRRAKRMK
ncbi:hypothetical protein F4781DRAFT_430751 [Annulohypoxylon bovei var. microspora]|nr:hypothetical protein F4781DRAFT_430751 [Annulohypoxylon bovei var. microspora]